MTERIYNFLKKHQLDSPCLVVDTEKVKANYRAFHRAFPETKIFYAIKANPAPQILNALNNLGACFDAASVSEVEMALAAGASPERVSYGNTIKKEVEVAQAYALGVRLYAVDSEAELLKIRRAAPKSRVLVRVLVDCTGAQWPLSRKFGCDPKMAVTLLIEAKRNGLDPAGLCFHVGSQQKRPGAWEDALRVMAAIDRELREKDVEIGVINLGGGFPITYSQAMPTLDEFAVTIKAALTTCFGGRAMETFVEPGRAIVGDAGILQSEVALIARKSFRSCEPRWVYLDIGKFGGLAETMDEAIRYPIRTPRDDDLMEPCILAGPTCDTADILYEKDPYPLPTSLQVGDTVWIEGAGAYTNTYAAVAFNGFAPLRSFYI